MGFYPGKTIYLNLDCSNTVLISRMSMDLSSCLTRFETWLSGSLPAIHATLQPGASQLELAELETLIGMALPDDFRALYAWHDGQEWPLSRDVPEVTGLLAGMDFLPLTEVSQNWRGWHDLLEEDPTRNDERGYISVPPGHIQTQYINSGWIAIAGRGTGDKIGIDLVPGPEGQRGQIVSFGRDERTKYVLAASLREFVCQYLERCEAGDVSLVELPGFDPPAWTLMLRDGPSHDEGVQSIAEYFPGFGAVPRRQGSR